MVVVIEDQDCTDPIDAVRTSISNAQAVFEPLRLVSTP